MDPDEKALHEHIITQYRQDADVLKFNLAQANAQNALKDRIIADQQALLELFPADAKPSTPEPPKPGPLKTRSSS